MRSRTSFFNRTVFLHDLKRAWPLTAAYALLWLIILPLSRLTAYANSGISDWNMLHESLNITAIGGYISAFLTGILFAMAAFSYLTNPRATNGLHALPARRETLFVSHYLSGLCSQLAGQMLAVLLAAAVLASHGAADARVTGLMLLTLALPTVFFYSFGVFCMMFTGQILAAPVFYGVLNVLVVGVELLVKAFAGSFLYGWAEPRTAALTPLSPIVQLVDKDIRAVGTANEYFDTGAMSGVRMTGQIIVRDMRWLWIYAAAGVVFAALALLVYRRRHSEATGNIVAVGWARPIFKYGVASCAALALGQLLYYLFFGQYRSNGDYSLVGSLLCMGFAGLIGFFAAEMLLKKSFRVWKTGWRGALGVTAALVALGVALSLDLTGYEKWVPDPAQVQHVNVDLEVYTPNGYSFVSTDDPETIRLTAEAHRALIADKRRQQAANRSAHDGEDGATVVRGGFHVSYVLTNGRVVNRNYSSLILDSGTLGDPASPAAALTALYNDENATLSRVLGRWSFNEHNDPRRLNDLRFTGGYYSWPRESGGQYLGDAERDLTPAEAKALFDAALIDVAAGRCKRSLFGEDERFVSIQLFATHLDTRDYSGSTAPTKDTDGRAQTDFLLMVTPTMTETLAAARAMGLEINFD